MTDEEPVRRFMLAVGGFGTIYGPYRFDGKDGCKRQPFWYWVAEGEDAWIVADRLWPWLSRRRCEQVTRAFAHEFRS
jgi:hypothetical protein